MLIEFQNGTIYRLPKLTAGREGVFYDSLESEATPLGRCYVDSIWFRRPIRLLDAQHGMAAQGEVWRCHIAGPVFAELLKTARIQHPESDLAAVWEIHASPWTAVAPQETEEWTRRAIQPEQAKTPEYHLDHPSICKTELLKD